MMKESVVKRVALRPRRFCVNLFVVLLVAMGSVLGLGQDAEQEIVFDEIYEMWPVDLTIKGVVMLCGSDELPKGTHDYFLKMAKRRFAKRESGKELPWVLHISVDEKLAGDELSKAIGSSDGGGAEDAAITSESLVDSGAIDLSLADGVWLTAAKSLGDGEARRLHQLEPELRKFVESGGVLFADLRVAPWLGKLNFKVGERLPTVKEGLNLIPDCVLVKQFETHMEPQLLSLLSVSPRSVGIGIPSGSLLLLSGRKLRACGSKPVTMMVAANLERPVKRTLIEVSSLGRFRLNPYRQMADLTAWRRDAIDRTEALFPPAKPRLPFVPVGTLVVVGGGGMPSGLMDRFIQLAGGPEARLVYIPCAEQERVTESQLLDVWRKKGVASATQLHTKDRNRANTDDTFLDPLRKATGIWFGGGRQWNFSDSYYGTEAHRLMKQVVTRGGVIGGSSAGASIQARYLARANPLGNVDIMADGYERGGLGFIGGVAIDQHFTQRRRQADMTTLVDRYPQLLGIGLDEKTAIIVRQSIAEVVGDGKAHFYDRRRPVVPGQPDYLALEQGARFDLAERVEVVDVPAESEEDKSK